MSITIIIKSMGEMPEKDIICMYHQMLSNDFTISQKNTEVENGINIDR